MYKFAWEKRTNDIKKDASGGLAVVHCDITLSWILAKLRWVLKACVLVCSSKQLATEVLLCYCDPLTKKFTIATREFNNNIACYFKRHRGAARVASIA